MSTFGTITSGLGGTRPDLIPFRYTGESDVYQIPYPDNSNLVTVGFQLSSKEEKRSAKIIENQLNGIVRTHKNQHHLENSEFIFFDGVIADKSSPGNHELIVAISGIEAFISNIFVGHKVEEFAWSGLSHTESNFLWLSLVETDIDFVDRRSSRVYRDFETRSTLTPIKPVGPENSVLVATYNSGVGINPNPAQRIPYVRIDEHVYDYDNPHGSMIYQDTLVVSGLNVRNRFIWDESTSGTLSLSGNNYQNVTYLQNLTQYGTMIVSGIHVNIHSGVTEGTYFETITDLEVDHIHVGNLTVVSGMSISGSLFRQNIEVLPDITVDGVDLTDMIPLIDGECLSGNPIQHRHAIHSTSGVSVSISPKYPGVVIKDLYGDVINPDGLGNNYPVEYNTDLGENLPTMYFKASNGCSGTFAYIRQFVPAGFHILESISVTHKHSTHASGTIPLKFRIYDSYGNNVDGLTALSGITTRTTIISGIAQSALGNSPRFVSNTPHDYEVEYTYVSGTACSIGEIVTRYRIQN